MIDENVVINDTIKNSELKYENPTAWELGDRKEVTIIFVNKNGEEESMVCTVHRIP